MMRSRQGNNVCYNVQLATDSKYKLIVTYDVTNKGNDQNQLAPMALAAKKELKVDTISALMDAGYFEKENIRICADENIDCYISRPQKSQNKQKSFFIYRDFKYDSRRDCYWCPAGEKLLYKGNKISGKKLEKAYWTLACKRCSIKSKCTTSKWVRRIYRWEFEDIIEKVEKKVKENPDKIKLRKALVEHPFGTIKHAMDQGAFLTRGIENVKAEMSLTALCYNIKRVLNIVDFKELMAAVQ